MKARFLTATLLMVCAVPFVTSAQDFKINVSGYFENANANVMVFNDVYPEGHQGGVTLVLSGERRAGNGDVRFEVSPGQWQGLPKVRNRVVDKDNNEIKVTLSYPDSVKHQAGFNPMLYPDFVFTYTITVKGEGDHIVMTADLDTPVPENYVGKLGLNLELTPSILLGKPWIMDGQTGIFPHQAFGPTMSQESNTEHLGNFNPKSKAKLEYLLGDTSIYNPMIADNVVSAPMAVGRTFVLNPHDRLGKITVEAVEGGDIKLYDGRINHNNGWFILRTEFAAGATKQAAKWIIRPATDPDWRYAPVVQTSQIGYHPAQKKFAVVELDARDAADLTPQLHHITADGDKVVKTGPATRWGKLFRYNYLQFDFSEVTEEGLYQVSYGDALSPVFRIAKDVWSKGVWQAEIEYFLPIMMCHMRVNEKYRVWHDRCHDDDAVMAPVDLGHIDGYEQGPSTYCDYKPGDRIPGVAVGGWHDAGDYDLRIESQSLMTFLLASMVENLGACWDETTIDFDKHIVEIHQPDGKNDYLQQVENGALSIVAGWKALGRLYRGIVCPTVRQYVHLGDAAAHTDGIIGTADDRWLFTEDNPHRELTTAAHMAAISRVLKGYNDELAADCLEIARAIYDRPAPAQTSFRGFGGRRWWSESGKTQLAAELYLTTGEKQYKDFVLSQKDNICENIGQCAWYIGRFDKALGDKKFSKAVRTALPQVKKMYDEYAAKSPYGITYDRGNRSSGSWEPQHLGFNYSWLCTYYPDIFEPDYFLNCMQYLLGMHPGSNQASFVTGVGADTMKQAYGNNRADWSYIPGGVAPGTNIIRPDLPELLKFPFIWQQGEYCIDGHNTNFHYMVMAADRLLNR